MRHTRMRQIAKANKDPMWMWKEQVGTDTIELMVRVHKLGLKPKLDKSFKWHRKHDYGDNWIEFGGDGYSYGVILEAKACYKTLKGLTK